MKILVCGGRDYVDAAFAFHALMLLHSQKPVTQVIEGGARGADRLGRDWARAEGIDVRTFPADWDQYGKSAGYRRNKQMLDEGQPEFVVAFPGGRGTENMVELATAAGLRIWRPRPAKT